MRAQFGAVILVIILLVAEASPCSLVAGYFYRVTAIRGRVVGRNWHGSILAPVQYWSWTRQRVRQAAIVSLYEYQGQDWMKGRAVLASTKTDGNGWFEFKDVKQGHYSLNISDGDLSDWFDVEITDKAKPTDYVKIDISPVFPDCKGGHEFEIHHSAAKN